jgi:manganese transport system permease protein
VSLAAVAGLQTVGIILVVAMLVTPGATAYLLTDRFDRMTWLAVLSAVSATVLASMRATGWMPPPPVASWWCRPCNFSW